MQINRYVDLGIGSMTAFISMTVWFGFITVLCGSVQRQKMMIAFASIVLCLLCPLIAFELTLSVVIADFCHGLEVREEDGVSDGSMRVFASEFAPADTLPLIEHYVACEGDHPLASDFVQAESSARALGDFSSSLEGECRPRALEACGDAADETESQVRYMEARADCSEVNPYYSELMYGVACGNVLEGLYHLWVVQLTCAVSIWILLFLMQCELLTRVKEGRLELARQEQRLKLVPSMFVPRKGSSARLK